MRDDQYKLLMLTGKLPARLNVEQVAALLNCQVHDVPILVSAKLLKPLGNPQPNAVKYFARTEVLELSEDEKWLNRVTATIYQHWQKRNARKIPKPSLISQGNPA